MDPLFIYPFLIPKYRVDSMFLSIPSFPAYQSLALGDPEDEADGDDVCSLLIPIIKKCV